MNSEKEKKLRIGQVCDLLLAEFPDISISKLRFLQDKGIIDPERTPGGYRIYSKSDVEALRLALTMQRDQFMPLKVIRAELDRRLKSNSQAQAAFSNGEHRTSVKNPVAGEICLGEPEPRVSAQALIRAADVTIEFLEACQKSDIVSGIRDDEGVELFTPDEVGLVALAGRLNRLGLELRHLRQVVMAMSRQGAIVEQFAAAYLRAPGQDAQQRGIRTVEALTGHLVDFLRIAFVRDVKQMTARTTGQDRSGSTDQMVTPLI